MTNIIAPKIGDSIMDSHEIIIKMSVYSVPRTGKVEIFNQEF